MATRPASLTKTSTPRLSETARHLVLPQGIVTTGWPSVRAQCLRMKITFDPWQDGAGSAILGKKADGLYAADAVVISIPRQVGKTFLIGAIVLSLAILNPRTQVLWSAHRYPTAEDAFNDMKAMCERPAVAKYISKIYDSTGKQRVVLKNGSRIYFGARERGWGRGFKRIAVLVFDEAQILTERAVDDMIPATNRHPNPLIFYMGTPPKPSDPSEHFTRMRQEAINGEASDVFYLEFGAEPDADPRDREQWAKANPSYPHHTTARAMMRMFKNLGLASFLREGLGIWDGTVSVGVFSGGAWTRCATTDAPGKPAALGVAADLDQTWLSLGAADHQPRTHLAAVLRERYDTGRAHFVQEVARIALEQGVSVAIDKKGPAAPLIPDLEAAGVPLVLMGLDDVVQACADLREAVETRGVCHKNYTELNEAVDAASWRKIGDRRAFARRDGDIAMLEAVTFARSITSSVYEERELVIY
jgi:hypothetical protein